MLEFLRNLTKSDEEKRREALSAYLDDALTSRERQQLERELAQDARLTAELEQMRLLRQQMRQLPRRRVPRNFTLDPALYGRPRREPLVQAYPVLRVATALTAFFFIVALAFNLLSLFTYGEAQEVAVPAAFRMAEPEAAAPRALEMPAAEEAEVEMAEDETAELTITKEEEAPLALEEAQPSAAGAEPQAMGTVLPKGTVVTATAVTPRPEQLPAEPIAEEPPPAPATLLNAPWLLLGLGAFFVVLLVLLLLARRQL